MPELRKRQARLAFNPLPTSSSPAGSPTNGARSYANVSYEGSPRVSKKRTVEELGVASEGTTFIPTPERSSQVTRSTRQSTAGARSKRARQSRITFSNHIGVKLDDSERERAASEVSSVESEGDVVRMRTKRKVIPNSGSIFGTQHRRVDESDSSDELAMLVEVPSKRKKNGVTRSERDGPAERKTRSKSRAEPDNEEDEEAVVPRSSKRKSHVDLTFAESESSGDDAPALYSSPKMKRRPSTKASSGRDDFIVASSEEDYSEMEVTRPVRKKSRRDRYSNGNLSEEVDVEEVDVEEVEGVEEKPRRRRLKRRHELSEQDREELDEDLANLKSSPLVSVKKPNPRAEALEALKRRRAGTDAPSSSAMMRSDALRILDTSEEEEEDAMIEADQGTSPTQVAVNETEDVDDFVIEDEDEDNNDAADTLELEMPLWATGFARMKPRELFRYAIEWMVHKKLNPAYPHKTADKYMLAFQKLNDEVQGLAGSKFTSSAWTRDFTISLQARPEMEVRDISASLRGALDLDKCQACNRSGHPATFEIVFHGRPYDPHTLEPVEQDFDSGLDDDEEANEPDGSVEERDEYDHKGRLVPPAQRAYAVGRFCKDNATTAHALAHWRFQLSDWVVDHLAESGHLTDRKIVRRDRWDEPRRRKYAQAIVEDMVRTGQVKALYHAFRGQIDSARERSGGWKGRADAGLDWV